MNELLLIASIFGPEPLAQDTGTWLLISSAVFIGTAAAWLATRALRLIATLAEDKEKKSS
jgi:ABC-type nickel/cobalt efflux system permease component RcnA